MNVFRPRWWIVGASAVVATGLAGAPTAFAADPPFAPPMPDDGWSTGAQRGRPLSTPEDIPVVAQGGDFAPDTAPRLTQEQLLELVGPIALYPDVVLASLLAATGRPLDVIAAARHVRASDRLPHAGVAGPVALTVPEGMTWDASVIAMLQFPDVLTWLDENLGWFEQLGDAMATEEAEVLAAIQEFRRRARDAGRLTTDAHIRVFDERAPEQPQHTVIVIEPARPEIVFVPIYDPIRVLQTVYVGYASPFTWSPGFSCAGGSAWAWHSIGWGTFHRRSRHYGGGLSYHHGGYAWSGFASTRDRHFRAGATRWRPSRGSDRVAGLAVRGSASSRSGIAADTRMRSTTRPTWTAQSGAPRLRTAIDVRNRGPQTVGSTAGADAQAPRRRVVRPAPALGGQEGLARTRDPDARTRRWTQDGTAPARTAATATPPSVSVPTPTPTPRARATEPDRRERPRFAAPESPIDRLRRRTTEPVAPTIQMPRVDTPRVDTPRVAAPRAVPTPRIAPPSWTPQTPRVRELRPQTAPRFAAPTWNAQPPRVQEPRPAPTPRVAAPSWNTRAPRAEAQPTERRRASTEPPPPPPRRRRGS